MCEIRIKRRWLCLSHLSWSEFKILKVLLFSRQDSGLIILLMYKTQPQQRLYQIVNTFCKPKLLWPSTKIVETDTKVPVNSWNALLFKKWNPPPYLLLSVLYQHCVNQQLCPRLRVINNFWQQHNRLVNNIKAHISILYILNSTKFKRLKWFPLINAYI